MHPMQATMLGAMPISCSDSSSRSKRSASVDIDRLRGAVIFPASAAESTPMPHLTIRVGRELPVVTQLEARHRARFALERLRATRVQKLQCGDVVKRQWSSSDDSSLLRQANPPLDQAQLASCFSRGTYAVAVLPQLLESMGIKRRRTTKVLRRRTIAPSLCVAQIALPVCQRPLQEIPEDVFRLIMSHVDVKTKLVSVLAVSSQVRTLMQHRTAWDPLFVDQAVGCALLRLLKMRDPLGCFASDERYAKIVFPNGFFEIRNFRAILMDADRADLGSQFSQPDSQGAPYASQSGTLICSQRGGYPSDERLSYIESQTFESGSQTSAYVPRIADPLHEMCGRLVRYFRCLCELTIDSISDYRLDYRFHAIRSRFLSDFGFVEVLPGQHLATLRAVRDKPPRMLNLSEVITQNSARAHPGARPSEDLSEAEALYLMEHRGAYKCGARIHFVHAEARTVRAAAVDQAYTAVCKLMRQRFAINAFR